MTDTISTSSKPRIKCFDGNRSIVAYDTIESTSDNISKLIEEEFLWTRESVHCICTHHVEQHCTIRDKSGYVVTIYCHSRSNNDENCNCRLFRPQSMKISSRNIAIEEAI